jgi:predicted kinase
MKNILIILCGISNSGKSTFTAKTVQHNPDNYISINRDKIRELLFGYTEKTISEYYHRNDMYKLEEKVTELENTLIHKYLREGINVIVDATHLKAKYLNRFIEYLVGKEIIFFNVTLKEALIRNSSRDRKVDEYIIINQYENYINIREFLTSNKLKYEYLAQEINN